MEKIMQEIGNFLQPLFTINLIKKENVISTLDIDTSSNEYVLKVDIKEIDEVTKGFCLRFFVELKGYIRDCDISIINNTATSFSAILEAE